MEQETLTRRLALGALGTAAFVALALLPDSAAPPSKPLFFYLVPLLRSRRAAHTLTHKLTNSLNSQLK